VALVLVGVQVAVEVAVQIAVQRSVDLGIDDLDRFAQIQAVSMIPFGHVTSSSRSPRRSAFHHKADMPAVLFVARAARSSIIGPWPGRRHLMFSWDVGDLLYKWICIHECSPMKTIQQSGFPY